MALYLNKNKKVKSLSIIKITSLTVLLGIFSFLFVPNIYVMAQEENIIDDTETEVTESNNDTLNALNQELTDKKEAIDELKKKSETYTKNIKVKQQETLTLQSQMQLIELQVGQTENDIETVREEIDKVGIELDTLAITIADKDVELDYRQEMLANFIRLIDEQDQQSYLEIIVSNQSFSDFFDDLQHTQDLQSNVKDALLDLKSTKLALEDEQNEKLDKKDELDELTIKLTDSITNLNSQQDYKVALLEDTKESEELFSLLLDQVLREERAVESEINYIEARFREKLEEEGDNYNIEAILMWPIIPSEGISAYFYDPSYEKSFGRVHPAIDIPAPQGINIRAAESGTILRVGPNCREGNLNYCFILIGHNSELSTVYGHVSRTDVIQEEYVVKGQIIGAVGGKCFTPGAGICNIQTTGSHLHFGVRYGGIPVNPLDYLP